MHRSLLRFTAVFAVLGLLLAACGDDDDEDAATTTTEADEGDDGGGEGNPDAAEFCEASAALDEVEGIPTDAQIDAYAEAAPEEIADVVADTVARFKAAPTDEDKEALFDDPEFVALLQQIEEYEQDNCPGAEGDDEALDPAATRVDVTATEYAFDAPTELEAGLTGFVLTNAGEEEHELALVRFKEGATMQQALEAEATGGDAEEFIEDDDVGRTAAVPGEEGIVNAELTAGTYGMVCFVPAPDGEPHAAKGMTLEFTVS